MDKTAIRPGGIRFDFITAAIAAVVVIGLAAFLVISNRPIADPSLFFVLRVVISFSAAALGATIPAFLAVGWSGSGLAIRAGGALALFVLTFLYTPELAREAISARSGGVAAGHDITVGPVTIEPPVPFNVRPPGR